jgi:hypothetical protein
LSACNDLRLGARPADIAVSELRSWWLVGASEHRCEVAVERCRNGACGGQGWLGVTALQPTDLLSRHAGDAGQFGLGQALSTAA